MSATPNTSRAIIAAAVIGVVGTITAEVLKQVPLPLTPQDTTVIKAQVTPSQSTALPIAPGAAAPSPAQSATDPVAQSTAEPIDLPVVSGSWYVETYHEKSSFSRYVGMKVRYKMNITQDGRHLIIDGVKVGDVAQGKEDFYGMDRQTPIRFRGDLQEDADGIWKMILSGTEDGALKKNQPIEAEIQRGAVLWHGQFSAQAASSGGPCVWIPEALFSEIGWAAGEKRLHSGN